MDSSEGQAAPETAAETAAGADPEAARAADAADWHAARLARTLFEVGRLGHDLRGLLSPALLAAERLQTHADPAVKRGADTVLRALDRAGATLRDSMTELRAASDWQPLEQVNLHAAIPRRADIEVTNRIPAAVTVLADADALARVFDTLVTCLRQCGVPAVTATATYESYAWTVRLLCEAPPDWADCFAAAVAAATGSASVRSDLAAALEWLASFGAETPRLDAEGVRVILRAR